MNKRPGVGMRPDARVDCWFARPSLWIRGPAFRPAVWPLCRFAIVSGLAMMIVGLTLRVAAWKSTPGPATEVRATEAWEKSAARVQVRV